MDNVIKLLGELNINETEAKSQLEDLDKAIQAQIIDSLLRDQPENISQEEATKILEEKMQDNLNQEIAKRISAETLNGYLDAITSGLEEEKKSDFKKRFIEASSASVK